MYFLLKLFGFLLIILKGKGTTVVFFFKLEDLYQKPGFGSTESLLVQGLKILKLTQGHNNARFAEVLLVQGGMNYVLVL